MLTSSPARIVIVSSNEFPDEHIPNAITFKYVNRCRTTGLFLNKDRQKLRAEENLDEIGNRDIFKKTVALTFTVNVCV
jgi:hypothetical protein